MTQDNRITVMASNSYAEAHRVAKALAAVGVHRRHGKLVLVKDGASEPIDSWMLLRLLSETVKFVRVDARGNEVGANAPRSLYRVLASDGSLFGRTDGLPEWMPGGPLDEARIVWLRDQSEFRYVRELSSDFEPRRDGMVKRIGSLNVVAYAELLPDAKPANLPVHRGFHRRYWHVAKHDASECSDGPYRHGGMPSEGVEPGKIVLGFPSFGRR